MNFQVRLADGVLGHKVKEEKEIKLAVDSYSDEDILDKLKMSLNSLPTSKLEKVLSMVETIKNQ